MILIRGDHVPFARRGLWIERGKLVTTVLHGENEPG